MGPGKDGRLRHSAYSLTCCPGIFQYTKHARYQLPCWCFDRHFENGILGESGSADGQCEAGQEMFAFPTGRSADAAPLAVSGGMREETRFTARPSRHS